MTGLAFGTGASATVLGSGSVLSGSATEAVLTVGEGGNSEATDFPTGLSGREVVPFCIGSGVVLEAKKFGSLDDL